MTTNSLFTNQEIAHLNKMMQKIEEKKMQIKINWQNGINKENGGYTKKIYINGVAFYIKKKPDGTLVFFTHRCIWNTNICPIYSSRQFISNELQVLENKLAQKIENPTMIQNFSEWVAIESISF